MIDRETSRRAFIARSSLVTAALTAGPAAVFGARPSRVSANDTINIGVVGTGGRGTGACHDCLSANYGVRLIAMGDLRTESCVRARGALGELGEKVSVKDEHIYAGLDAYKRVFDHPDVDVVILTTSPGFRPVHLVEAVQAGKHVFAEKPVCVDPAGYRAVVEAGRLAKRNNTAIVTGTQYRRQPSYVEAIEHIHDGMIGRVTSAVSDYCSSGIWYRDRQPGMSDLEYQLYNWYHFVWLSGDQIAEQAVHNLDAVNWAIGANPISAYGGGGQMTRPADSEIWDNVNIDYAYPGNVNVSFKCRQIPNTKTKVINTFVGTKGIAWVNPGGSHIESHDGEELFHYEGRGNNPYQQEHADLIASVRAGTPIVEIQDTADSSLTAVLGRMAAYTGQEVEWDFAVESKEALMPPDLGPDTVPPAPRVRVPGREALI